MDQNDTDVIAARLSDGTVIHVQATRATREQLVSATTYELDEFFRGLRSISTSVVSALRDLTPNRTQVEFGLDVSLETGKLTSLLVKGAASANVKVTLEWERPPAEDDKR